MADKSNSDHYQIKVVEKAIRLLRVLVDGKPRTLTEISHEININTSTTFRLLATLTNHNFTQFNEQTGEYRLGLACLELAVAYQTGNELLRVAHPELERLRDLTKETVHLAVLDDMEVIYIEKLEGLHAIGIMSSRVGKRAPAYCTGVGKMLLSHVDPQILAQRVEPRNLEKYNDRTIVEPSLLLSNLAEAKRKGYALDSGEHENEVRCVAAPVFDQRANVVAAISVSGPSSRLDPIDKNEDLIRLTTQVAKEISSKLGYQSIYQ
ncbi:MAG: IclR family transcriptional regulator [Brevefilum sp.]|nr:IclR family transcriptional regulator [Brevefilum sp.]